MLKEILSITGKPGLYKIITPGKRTLLVEDMVSKKRFPGRKPGESFAPVYFSPQMVYVEAD